MGAIRPGRLLLAFLLAYGSAHGLVRLWASPVADVDVVVEVVYSQAWRAGYDLLQPPLYGWLSHLAREAGVLGIPFFVFLKYALFTATVWCVFLAARRMTGDEARAVLAALSLLLFYQVGWNMHGGVTQTQILMLAMAATLAALVRLVETGDSWTYVALGVAIGLGLLSKAGYPLFLVSLLAALWSEPATRRRLRPGGLVVALTIGLGIAAPYLLWLAQQTEAVLALPTTALGADPAGDSRNRASGAFSFALMSLGFLMPLAAVLLLLWPRIAMRPAADNADPPWRRILGRSLLVAAGLALAAVLLLGIPSVRERWLHPIWLFAGLYGALRLQAAAAPARVWRRFAVAIGIGVLLVLTIRILEPLVGPPFCDTCRPMRDYAELARAIADDGLAAGTLVAGDEHVAGNLSLLLPRARVVMAHRSGFVPNPRSGVEACVLVWRPGRDEGRIARAWPALAVDLTRPGRRHVRSVIRPPLALGGEAVRARWAFIPVADPSKCP